MDTLRFILIISLTLVVLQLWQAWEQDYGQTQISAGKVHDNKYAQETIDSVPDLPVQGKVPAAPESVVEREQKQDEWISVTTDNLDLKISLLGGEIRQADLLDYPQTLEPPKQPVRLFFENEDSVYLFQGGIISKQSAPTHEAAFIPEKKSYSLEYGQDELAVPLVWDSGEGLRIIKSYVFHRGKYDIEVKYQIDNNSAASWSGRAYGQLQRTDQGNNRARLIYTYRGAVISSPEKRYEKIDYDDIRDEKVSKDIINGWVAMLQHYFISALIPFNKTDQYHYYTSTLGNDKFAIGFITPAVTIESGATGMLAHKLYIGPKIQGELEKLSEGLELTVDYGVLWFIAKPLFWCLEAFHSISGNWGWSIVLVTLMLKILFYQLSAAGYRSMANMRRVQPRMLSIRDRYKNDRAKLNQAMMDIYKKEKINPLGGCFPILIQIPVFIALYWVLLESVELRQTPFILWIKDLSTPDPYFVLPVVMGVTMMLQQKLNPAPMDPVQEKVMMVLPLVFTVFFAFFPSGLVLYWVVNNILSILQQWMITRKLEQSGLK